MKYHIKYQTSNVIIGIPLIVTIFSSTVGLSQIGNHINRDIYEIKSVPHYYYKHWRQYKIENPEVKFNDTAYLSITNLDTFAIPYLIEKIVDTSFTNITNSCTGLPYRIGDLAVLLIRNIEPILYNRVTGGDWDEFGDCGILPDGFLEYVDSKRIEFKNKYSKFYYSHERQTFVRDLYKKNHKEK